MPSTTFTPLTPTGTPPAAATAPIPAAATGGAASTPAHVVTTPAGIPTTKTPEQYTNIINILTKNFEGVLNGKVLYDPRKRKNETISALEQLIIKADNFLKLDPEADGANAHISLELSSLRDKISHYKSDVENNRVTNNLIQGFLGSLGVTPSVTSPASTANPASVAVPPSAPTTPTSAPVNVGDLKSKLEDIKNNYNPDIKKIGDAISEFSTTKYEYYLAKDELQTKNKDGFTKEEKDKFSDAILIVQAKIFKLDPLIKGLDFSPSKKVSELEIEISKLDENKDKTIIKQKKAEIKNIKEEDKNKKTKFEEKKKVLLKEFEDFVKEISSIKVDAGFSKTIEDIAKLPKNYKEKREKLFKDFYNFGKITETNPKTALQLEIEETFSDISAFLPYNSKDEDDQKEVRILKTSLSIYAEQFQKEIKKFKKLKEEIKKDDPEEVSYDQILGELEKELEKIQKAIKDFDNPDNTEFDPEKRSVKRSDEYKELYKLYTDPESRTDKNMSGYRAVKARCEAVLAKMGADIGDDDTPRMVPMNREQKRKMQDNFTENHEEALKIEEAIRVLKESGDIKKDDVSRFKQNLYIWFVRRRVKCQEYVYADWIERIKGQYHYFTPKLIKNAVNGFLEKRGKEYRVPTDKNFEDVNYLKSRAIREWYVPLAAVSMLAYYTITGVAGHFDNKDTGKTSEKPTAEAGASGEQKKVDENKIESTKSESLPDTVTQPLTGGLNAAATAMDGVSDGFDKNGSDKKENPEERVNGLPKSLGLLSDEDFKNNKDTIKSYYDQEAGYKYEMDDKAHKTPNGGIITFFKLQAVPELAPAEQRSKIGTIYANFSSKNNLTSSNNQVPARNIVGDAGYLYFDNPKNPNGKILVITSYNSPADYDASMRRSLSDPRLKNSEVIAYEGEKTSGNGWVIVKDASPDTQSRVSNIEADTAQTNVDNWMNKNLRGGVDRYNKELRDIKLSDIFKKDGSIQKPASFSIDEFRQVYYQLVSKIKPLGEVGNIKYVTKSDGADDMTYTGGDNDTTTFGDVLLLASK